MERQEFFLRLNLLPDKRGIRIKQLRGLLGLGEPPETLLDEIGCSAEQKRAFWKSDRAKLSTALEWLEGENHHLIFYHDEDYPALLREISSAPSLLFVQGNPENLHAPQIAMVGSRQFTEYGQHWAHHFAYELAAAGLIVTSGLALGIDSICHRGALDGGGITLAVLGSGHLHLTPRSHCYLAAEILEKNGTIVSEFLPTERARPEYFPRRNRIVSGLCSGVFVAEAALKSGSLITARYAIEQGRDVFALPGPVDNPCCEGTHWLIQQGAYLVTKPSEIIEQLNSHLNWIPAEPLLSAPEISVPYPELHALLSSSAQSADRLAEQLKQPINNVMVQLVELELLGLAKSVSGGFVKGAVHSRE